MSVDSKNIPQCVGFIMDGNRRFATTHGLDVVSGHRAGKDTFFQVVEWIAAAGIPHAVFYTFSTENWRRDREEVDTLMQLFLTVIQAKKQELAAKNIAVRIVGRREDLSPELQAAIVELETVSSPQPAPKVTLWIALSYGGRAEIVSAVNEAVARGQQVDEETFSSLLSTAGMPDPDLIIRTGGEQRLSNFLPWQGVYSELFFTETYWPAFTKDEFTRILSVYGDRERRRGA